MYIHRRTSGVVSTCVALLVLMACGKAPPPPAIAPPVPPPPPPAVTIVAPPEAETATTMTLRAAADVNPNDADRPSPVVVRVYQLRTGAAFDAATFRDLYADDAGVLGRELITRDEYILRPGEARTLDVALSSEARVIGALAAFQELSTAVWRSSIEAPRGGLVVRVERSRVVIAAE